MPEHTSHPGSYIATRDLAGANSTRGSFTIRVSIGQPYCIDTDEWACPVSLEGLYSSLRDQHGVDSFQALMLAQSLARTLLAGFVEDGGKLMDPESGASVSVEAMFAGGALT